jgi:hypothetical protein
MRRKANWTRIVLAVFAMAVFYASVCSASCAVGVCPNQVQQTASHDCDQMPSHHSAPSGHETPDTPDCSKHQHPGLFVMKSGDVSQFQLSAVDHLNVSATAFSPVCGLTALLTQAEASEHGPPLVSSVPLYEQISVLRI